MTNITDIKKNLVEPITDEMGKYCVIFYADGLLCCHYLLLNHDIPDEVLRHLLVSFAHR